MKTRFLFLVLALTMLSVNLASAQTLTATPASLLFGTDKPLGTNAILPYTLSGATLAGAPGSITVTAPAGCLVSLSNTSGFASSIGVAYGTATLSATTIYIMFSPASTTAINANVTNAGGSATTVNVAITGTAGVNAVTNWVRPTAGGNWSALSWEATTDVGASWTATSAPTGAENIVIPGTYTVTVDNTLSISGYLKDLGIMPTPTGTLTIANGGTYELGHAPATSQGIPTATWSSGSTCLLTGIMSVTTGINANQAFHHLKVNCPNWSGNLNVGWASGTISIGGNVTVQNTGSGRWQLCAPTAGNSVTVNIGGNLILDGSASSTTALVGVTSNGTSNGTTTIVINIAGNVTVTGNATNTSWTNFALSRGSQGGTGTSVFNLSGDFSMSDATTQNSNVGGAKFVFVKSGTQNITWTNVTQGSSGNNMQVNSGSTLQLNSGISLNGTVTLNGGKINTSNANLLTFLSTGAITGGSSTSFVNGPMAHTIASTSLTTKTFNIGKGTAYRPVTLAITQSAATSTTYTAEVINSAPLANTIPGTLGPTISKVRYWSIVGNPITSITSSTVQITYDTDDGVTDNANLRIAQGPSTGGGAWVDLGGAGTANTTGTIISTNALTDFSTATVFTLANNTIGTNVLPVELTSFSGASHGRNVELQWRTATEVNNSGFEIQKNVSGSWAKIGFVDGAGTSNAQHIYSFVDVNSAATTYSYRLKQIDRDGKFSYSNVVEVTTALTAEDFKLSQNYPNPFNPSTKLSFAVKNAEQTSLKIYNVVGGEVATLFNDVAQPNQVYTLTFDAKNLSSGMYYYVLHSASRNEVKKMMLLK